MSEEWLRWALGLNVTGMLAMFGWMLKMLSSKASRESVDKRFEALLGAIRDQRTDLKMHEADDRQDHKDVLEEIRETNREIRQTNQHLATTNATLSNLVGRFDATNGH